MPDAGLESYIKKISFPVRVGFHKAVKQRANQYFGERHIAKTGDLAMFLKTGIAIAWLVISYVLLVFFSTSLIVGVVTAFALAQGFVLVGFNVMHDGAHGSYSKNKTINRLMAFTLDLIGGSQMLWRQKHNILHHTYTNIDDLDDDLHTSGLLRLSPDQRWRPWHRFQHFYAFPLYSLLTLNWLNVADFQKLLRGRIGQYRLQRPTNADLFMFFLMKAFYIGYALALPLLFHPFWKVLVAFVAVHLILGFTLSLVFRLAHTVEGNTFPKPDAQTGFIKEEWAIHEVETTANFAPNNRLVTWYMGGLNYQIEHHLFPKVCHIHYPAMSEIVEKTCREFAISYTSYPTLRSAIGAHLRFLKRVGSRHTSSLEWS